MHFPGACTLKAVVVQLDDEYAMCVLRCTRRVDLDVLAKVSGSKSVRLATAAAMREIAPAAEVRSYLPCVSKGLRCEQISACCCRCARPCGWAARDESHACHMTVLLCASC